VHIGYLKKKSGVLYEIGESDKYYGKLYVKAISSAGVFTRWVEPVKVKPDETE